MPPKRIKLLEDVRDSAEFILVHTRTRTLAEYEADPVLSAAVERHFIILGEALARLTRLDAEAAVSLGDCPQIIGFRNIVVHGYDVIEHAIVWGIIQNEIPGLLDRVRTMI